MTSVEKNQSNMIQNSFSGFFRIVWMKIHHRSMEGVNEPGRAPLYRVAVVYEVF
jgi:hypothetical protein